jgi:hypothetical protein
MHVTRCNRFEIVGNVIKNTYTYMWTVDKEGIATDQLRTTITYIWNYVYVSF